MNNVRKLLGTVFFLLVLSSLIGGCATVNGRTVLFLQRGVILSLVHACTDSAIVYQAGVGEIGRVSGATPLQIPMQPAVMGDREIQVTVQSIDPSGKIVGTYNEEFHIDSQSTRARSWTISNGYSGGDRQTRCEH